jgi:hypothetical protein
MPKAPIAFFAYNRPEHTRKSLESLAANEGTAESELFIFCDGPKNPEDEEAVREVRRLVKSRKWCGKVNILERNDNLGLADSIIGGVTDIVNRYGNVIVLEDDLVIAPCFLKFMNEALEYYINEKKVMQISGNMFDVVVENKADAIFLPFTTSWGWATWERSWKHFDPIMSKYNKLKKDKSLRYKFNLEGAYDYFNMLESQIKGNIDSWAIRWYLSVFMMGGLTLYPVRSLVRNIGFDGSGIHCGTSSFKQNSEKFEILFKHNIYFPEISVTKGAYYQILKYFFSQRSVRIKLKALFFKLREVGLGKTNEFLTKTQKYH